MLTELRSRLVLMGGVTLCAAALGCGQQNAGEAEDAASSQAALTSGTPLVGVESGRCLDVAHNSTTPGTPLQIFQCNGGANQGFTFTAAGELRAFESRFCVEATGTARGAGLVIGSCTGQLNQQWRQNANKSISSAQSQLCLDVTGRQTADRSPVEVWTCNGQTNQQWSGAAADTQPPTAPSGLATSNVTCNSATLAWSASTDNVGVAFYDVFHDGQLIKTVDGATRSTSITVVPGVTWGLYVNARDTAGNVSQASSTLPITPPQCQVDTQPPSAPGNLSGNVAGTSVTLSWSASSDNVGVKAYDIFRGGVQVGSVLGSGTTPPVTSFMDSALAANAPFSYFVVARDAQANVSTRSNTISVTTGQSCSVCSTTQVGTDTDIPWGLVNLPDGTFLYSERDAQNIVRLDPSNGQKTTIVKLPNVQGTDGEGGLLGLAIATTFASDRWLYVMHTSATDNRIVRVKYASNNSIDTSTLQVLVSGILRNKFHNGGRLRFGPDGKLYASTGDAQNGANAQNTSGLNGKVLRINPDGSVPSDNPFGNYVWSYGHRNPQGLAFDAQGRLWEQEFGNAVMDETNLIQKGGNYGWPDCEGTTSQAGSGCGTAGFIAPKHTYPTAEGSCSGIAIVRGVLYVACERGTRLYREVISGSSLTNVEQFFVGTFGRLRTVEPTADGNLWLTTTNLGDKDSIANNSNEKLFKVLLGQ